MTFLKSLKPFFQKFFSPPLNYLLRGLTLLISLFILASFFTTNPQTASKLYQQILTRFHLQKLTSTTVDLESIINHQRVIADQTPLTSSDQLDQVAKLITLSALDNSDLEPTIPLDQATAAVGHQFSNITSFTGFLPDLYVNSDTLPLSSDQLETIKNPAYTHIGTYQTISPFSDQPGIVYSIIFSQPTASTQSSTNSSSSNSTPTLSYYTGVELWQAVQQYRREHGVPEFTQDNTLCTLTSIRVNQLLELGKLDDHKGFAPLVDEYRDSGQLTHNNIAENILSGFPTAQAAVDGWDSSLGHQSLMKDGSYVYACTSANSGFGVLIAAY